MMNLSKTEKLLAAKKKLKEFQLQKMLHAQEVSNKPQNEDTVGESMSECQITCQNAETDASSNQNNQNEIKYTENLLQSEKHMDNTNIIYKEDNVLNNAFGNGNNLLDVAENTTIHNQVAEKNFPLSENYIESTRFHESENKDDRHTFPNQPDLQFMKNDEKYKLAITPSNKTSVVQKEHLLEMASEVANVLTDNIDHNEATTYDVSNALDLKYHNEFLSTCLQEQQQAVNDLHIQVSHYLSRISELERTLAVRDSDFEAKLIREVNPIKEQLQVHAQTTGILIAEKAELTAALSQSQKTAKHNSELLEEMSGKMKHSQFRVNELEKELIQTRNNSTDTQKNAHQIQQICDELDKKYCDLRKEKEDLELETSELKQKLNLKNTEFISLQQEFQEKAALLSLHELKIQQLTDTSQTLESQHQTVTILEQQLAQIRETLKLVNNEKDEASKQYQNYVRQLDTQQSKLFHELDNGKKIIADLENREKNYLQRLSSLEQQYQNEREKNESLLPLRERDDNINSLMKNIEELTLQQEKLHVTLSEKDAEIEVLAREIQELRYMKNDNADAAKLVQALESEKLGASRAVSQNHQLKQQLNEMENAFVTLSNAKLDLTEQLQGERSIGRKLNAKLNIVEMEVDNLKEKLREKEAFLMELEKEKLQKAQITDQMQHYQAQSQHAHTLQQELQNALIYIENLKKENEEITKKLAIKRIEDMSLLKKSVNSNGDQYTVINQQNADRDVTTQDLSLPENRNSENIEPITKLEKRFKETMEKVAELTDEKQRLEHLVLQLQSETETIGEYITLYQKQREVLGNRWKEKEQSFRQLSEQRNQQQEQLHKLKILVIELLKKYPKTINPTESCTECHKEVIVDGLIPTGNEKQEDEEPSLIKDKTTSEILDLLTEIKDCKDTCITEPNFHPCPWCSGRLMTI